MKAEMAASEAHAKKVKADYDAETAANPDFYNPKSESNMMYEPTWRRWPTMTLSRASSTSQT
jgi:hypothetical protein